MEKKRYYISFFPDRDCESGAMRETLVYDATWPADQRMHNKARKVARQIGARGYAVFTLLRAWRVDDDDDEDELGDARAK